MNTEPKKYHRILSEYFHAKDYFQESIEDQRKRVKQLPPTPRPVNIRKTVELPWQRIQSQDWDEVGNLFSDLHFLESKTESGKVFDLAKEFSLAIKNIPSDRPKRRDLFLLEEALRRDIHFIARHPTTFFQCMWNLCWWYDSDEAASHYERPKAQEIEATNFIQPKDSRLYELLEKWKYLKKEERLNTFWIRSCLPPLFPLGGPLIAQVRSSSICHCSWSMDGKFIATAAREKSITIWDAFTLEKINEIALNDFVYHVAYACDSKRLAVTGTGTIDIIDIETGILLHSMNEKETGGRIKFDCEFKWSPDGLCLATFIFTDQTLRVIVWNKDGKHVATLDTGQKASTPGFLSWAPNGRQLAIASWTDIRIWNIESNTSITIHEEMFGLKTIAWNPDGQRIAWGSNGGNINIYDVGKGEILNRLRAHNSIIDSISWSQDGRRIACCCGSELSIWDSITSSKLAGFYVNHDDQNFVTWAPDGRRVVSIGKSHTLRIWDTESAGQELQPKEFIWWPDCIVYSPNGRLIATKYRSGSSAKLWNAQTGAIIASIPGISGHRSNSVSFSPDSTKIAANEEKQSSKARIWNAENGTEVVCLSGHTAAINFLSFSPDGKKIVTASDDQTVRVWDAESGATLAILNGVNKYMGDIIWHPDGKTIACCIDGSRSDETNTKLWNPETDIEQGLEKGMIMYKARFSTDGRYLIGGGFADRSTQPSHPIIRVWDVKTGAYISEQKSSIGMETVDVVAGINRPPLQLIAQDIDHVIKLSDSETIVAWYNLQHDKGKGDYAIPSPTGSAWAIPINGLSIISLENWDDAINHRYKFGDRAKNIIEIN